MKRRPLWKVSIATSAEAEDAVTELLAHAFGQPVVSYRDIETGHTSVTAYLHERPASSRGWREDLQRRLNAARACGLNTRPGQISLASVRWEDWAESWKRHFKPIAIGSALLVKPSWSRLRPRKRQAVVVLDPGLSFGTGQHPTTAFCLQQVVKRRQPGTPQSLLDIGTGSGILAIAAAKLGYAPVHAFDLDPESIRVARANACQNDVAGRIRFTRQDLAQASGQRRRRYSVVCANLISTLLLAQREQIVACIAPAGVLLLAGILKAEFTEVQAAYEASGLRLIASRTQREWRSAAFVAAGSLPAVEPGILPGGIALRLTTTGQI
jgi:ribosomal protein L11 methyltransferase